MLLSATKNIRLTRHPASYNWRERFPEHQLVAISHGYVAFCAQDSDGYWLIKDASSMAEFLDNTKDEAILDRLVLLVRFDNERDWQQAVHDTRTRVQANRSLFRW